MRNLTKWLLACLIPMINAGYASVSEEPGSSRAWIEVSESAGMLQVSPYAVVADHDAELRYSMTSEKQGPAGRSNSTQSGKVRVNKAKARQLASLGFGLHEGDHYRFTLELYEVDRLVARQVLEYPEAQ